MATTTDIISAERQREIVDQIWLVGLNKGDLSVADKYLTDDFQNHGSHDDSLTGPASFKLTIEKQRSGFSEIEYEILDFVSYGDKCAVRWIMKGVHTGTFLGIEPTGKRVEHHAILILRFEGDKIAERWGIVDNFQLMRHLKAPGPNAPYGTWKGAVTYEGNVDEYTIEFTQTGQTVMDTEDSVGTGTWVETSPNTFVFTSKEQFKLDEHGNRPAKVIQGADYVQIAITATRDGDTFSGVGTAEVRGLDGSIMFATKAETAASKV